MHPKRLTQIRDHHARQLALIACGGTPTHRDNLQSIAALTDLLSDVTNRKEI